MEARRARVTDFDHDCASTVMRLGALVLVDGDTARERYDKYNMTQIRVGSERTLRSDKYQLVSKCLAELFRSEIRLTFSPFPRPVTIRPTIIWPSSYDMN